MMLQNRFKKILVPLDGSLNSIRGLNEAISLARQSGSTITGIFIMPKFPYKIARVLKQHKIDLVNEAMNIMSQARSSTARHGIPFEEKVATSSDIVKTISNFAKSRKFDIIVLGSRGQSVQGVPYPGSVANGILNTSDIPVLLVK